MKPSIIVLLLLACTSGCEIRAPRDMGQRRDRAVLETKTGSYETAEPLGTNAMAEQIRRMNQQMLEALGEPDENYEKRFIDMMIPHHEGGVLMAQHALDHSNRDELKQMARKMIDAQQREIQELKELRAKWYGE